MSHATEGTTPAACPRCRSSTIALQSASPVVGAWTVYGCTTCLYTWRSTEPEMNTDPDKYPAAFRLKAENMPNLAISPSIPPRRQGSAGG
jgi:vanillate/4-hydroxybenzoate decarboxylase subunit D